MRGIILASLALAGFAVAPVAEAKEQANDCRQQLKGAAAAMTSERDVTVDDLARLRDIGRPSEQFGSDPIVRVSPDGDKIAFQMRRADPDRNAYCLGVFVLDLKRSGEPRLLDEGGELIRTVKRGEKIAVTPNGDAQLLVPSWSADSAQLSYLRRDHGVTQAWRVAIETGQAAPATASTSDVETIGWAGQALVFSTRRDLDEEQARIDREGRSGFLYDDRFDPLRSSRPFAPGGQSAQSFILEVGSTRARPASAEEQFAARSLSGIVPPPQAVLFTAQNAGHRAWTFALPITERVRTGSADPTRLYATSGLQVETPHWTLACRLAICDGVIGLWLDAKHERLLFLRREGWRGTTTTLYDWRFGARAPRAIVSTRDHIVGCDLARRGLVCGQETATQPRRLVLFDTQNGRMSVLFDPNPEFSALRLGQVRRLEWKNALGLEGFGSLVIPPGHDGQGRLPLVIVQYQNRGFLRGGTGDEYPVHVLAARGIAVLAVDRPLSYAYLADGRSGGGDAITINRRNNHNWADRRSTLDALRAGLEQVFALRLVDPSRVGITGLSNGSTSAQFAMLNSDLISVAALSGCCDDEFVAPVSGLSGADYLEKTGRPLSVAVDPRFYSDLSLAQHADRLVTPLLIQSSDAEYLFALPTVTALTLKAKPVELYVYPNEYHVKWQPAHRLAVYTRNVDWFCFWLLGVVDHDPAKQAQYARWIAMRDRIGAKP